MIRYLLTSEKFEGTITYGFNDEGFLFFFEVNAPALTLDQWHYLLNSLGNCLMQDYFTAWAKQVKFKIIELQEDLSFEAFWDAYNMKRNIDKARPIWEKMPEQDKQRALASIPAYKRYCAKNANWYNQLYPDTYLRNSHWKAEWDKI